LSIITCSFFLFASNCLSVATPMYFLLGCALKASLMEHLAPLAPLPPLFAGFVGAAEEELGVTMIVGVATASTVVVDFTSPPAPAVFVAITVANDVGTGLTAVALLDGMGAAEGTALV
jgi:hypothetical protein